MSTAPSGSRARRILVVFLALLCGSILATAVLEILLRLYNPFFARVKGQRIVLQVDKKITFQNTVIAGLDRDITVTRNSLGFRGPNPPADWNRHLTMFTIGGSTTQSFMVSDDKTWTAVLAGHLAPRFPSLWVNNAGLDGHTTFGHRVLLVDQIAPRRPTVVTFLVGANDVALAAPNDYDAENMRGEGLSFRSGKAFVKSLSTYSEVVALGLNFYRSFTAYQAGLLHSNIDLAKMTTLPLDPVRQQELVAATARPELLAAYRKRLGGLVQIARQAGILPVFITQPTLWGEGKDDVTGIDLAQVKLASGNGETAWHILEAYNDVTRSVCAAENVPCIDLARQLPKSRRLFYDNAHFTVEGNRETGRLVARALCGILAERFPAFVNSAAPCPE